MSAKPMRSVRLRSALACPFLASNELSLVIGAELVVDGGYLAR